MKLATVLGPGLILGLAIASVSRADIPPPRGYVEKCTVKKQEDRRTECILCGDAYHGDVDACERQHAAAGYERRCKTSGASVWEEVWCKPSAITTPPTDTNPAAPSPASGHSGGKGCSLVVAGSDGVAGMGWLLAVLGLGLAGSRRRRR